MKLLKLLSLAALSAIVLSACGPAATPAPQPTEPPAPAQADTPQEKVKVKVRVVLQWVPQSQFAGYYAALKEGFYEQENLDVEIIPGGPDIAPAQVVASGGAEFIETIPQRGWILRDIESTNAAA